MDGWMDGRTDGRTDGGREGGRDRWRERRALGEWLLDSLVASLAVHEFEMICGARKETLGRFRHAWQQCTPPMPSRF